MAINLIVFNTQFTEKLSYYHFEFIIIPNCKHEYKYEILAHQISTQIEDLDIQAN